MTIAVTKRQNKTVMHDIAVRLSTCVDHRCTTPCEKCIFANHEKCALKQGHKECMSHKDAHWVFDG